MSKQRKGYSALCCEWEIEVRDKDNKLIKKMRGKSHTWVRNYIRFLREIFANRRDWERSFTVTDTGGVGRTAYAGVGVTAVRNIALGVRATSGESTYGIQVGSSDFPYARDQYCLQSMIAHGTGAGQLLYGEVTVEDCVLEDSTERFRVVRAFTNSSGSPVTVREIGLTTVNQYGTTYYYFLLCRDVLPSPISVPDGASLTVRYRIFISYV